MSSSCVHSSSIIQLNIGGKQFCTTVETLTLREPDSMLAAMFSGRHDVNSQKSEKGSIFIDRDGKHFRHILNWLRDGAVPIMEYRDYMELLREAEFFQLGGLVGEIKAKIAGFVDERCKICCSDLTRTDTIKCLQLHHSRSNGCKLPLEGVNLSGVDLSGLDLHDVNFTKANLSCANLKGSNLKGAILDSANLTQANLSSANLSSTDLRYANLECANLEGVNLDEPHETTYLLSANLEGSSLVSARLKFGDSTRHMNLTRANLKGAIINVAASRNAVMNSGDYFWGMPAISDHERAALKYGIILTGANLTDSTLSFDSN